MLQDALQRLGQPKELPQWREAAVRRELDQEVGIAGVWIEIPASSSRTDHLQTPHAVVLAEFRKFGAVLVDQSVHDANPSVRRPRICGRTLPNPRFYEKPSRCERLGIVLELPTPRRLHDAAI